MHAKNMSAFPVPEGPTTESGRTAYTAEFGLTIRAYFAAKMMQGLLICEGYPIPGDFAKIARDAVKAADALAEVLGMGEVQEITEPPF